MDLAGNVMEVDAPAESIFSNLNVNIVVKEEHDEDLLPQQHQQHHPSLNDLLFGSSTSTSGIGIDKPSINNNFMCTNEVKNENESAGVSPCSSRDENIGPERIFKNEPHSHVAGEQGHSHGHGGGPFGSSSSSSGSGEKILDDVSFMSVLSSETVFKMAKSVGVEITKDAAFSLGQLAMERIRNVTHHAMQLCKHERSRALTSDHFTRSAAKIYDYHFLPIDHTIERKNCLVDVNSVIKSKRFNEIQSDVQEPSFNYHFANFHDSLSEQNWRKSLKLSFLKSTDSTIDDEKDDDDKNQTPSKSNKSNKKKSQAKSNSKKPINNHDIGIGTNHVEEFTSDSSENEEKIEETDQDEYIDKLISKNINKYYSSNDPLQDLLQDFNENDISSSKESSQGQDDICMSNLSPTWVNYYSMFLESFFSLVDPSLLQDKEKEEEEDKNYLLFQKILQDIERNGIYPILSILCKFFLHYLKGDYGEIEEYKVEQILNVFKSLSNCSIKPNQLQVQVISLVLIKILIMQPSIQLLKSLSRIFFQIIIKSGIVKETFTWTNKYITEALKVVSTTSSKELSENHPYLLFSALSLANQIENHGYRQFHKNEEWINLLLKILEEKNNTFDISTEEVILHFLNILFTKYIGIIPHLKLNTLFNSFSEICGEKLIPITCQKNDFISIIPLNWIKISKSDQEPYRYPYPVKRNKRICMNLSARSRRRRIIHQSKSASATNSTTTLPSQDQKDLNIPSVSVNNDPENESTDDDLMPKPKRIKLQENLLMDTT